MSCGSTQGSPEVLRSVATQFHAIARERPWLHQLVLVGSVFADHLPQLFARKEDSPPEANFEHGLEVTACGGRRPISGWCVIPSQLAADGATNRHPEFNGKVQVCWFGEESGSGAITVYRELASSALRCLRRADHGRWSSGLGDWIDPGLDWGLMLHRVARSRGCPAITTTAYTSPSAKPAMRFQVDWLNDFRSNQGVIGDLARSVPDPPLYWWAILEPNIFLASALFIEGLLLPRNSGGGEQRETALSRPIPVCKAAEQLGDRNLLRDLKRRGARIDNQRPARVELDDLLRALSSGKARNAIRAWADREFPA
jgi:hypothetical protein